MGNINRIALLPVHSLTPTVLNSNTTLLIDADGEEFAIKHYPKSTSPITEVDLLLGLTGTLATTDFKIRIESDNADYPSGSVLGAATAAFNVSANGWTGLKALVTNTGTLTLNTPVWIVCYRSGGGSVSGTNYISARGVSNYINQITMVRGRYYASGAWNASASTFGRASYIVKHDDGTYDGVPVDGATVTDPGSTSYRIYSTMRQSFCFKVGSPVTLTGIDLTLAKTGSPSNLEVLLYRGDSLQLTETITASSIITTVLFTIDFSSAIKISPGENIYIVLRQASDGGNSSNYYSFRSQPYNSTYKSVLVPPDFAYLQGTGDTPSGYSEITGYLPLVTPVIFNPATAFESGVYQLAALGVG